MSNNLPNQSVFDFLFNSANARWVTAGAIEQLGNEDGLSFNLVFIEAPGGDRLFELESREPGKAPETAKIDAKIVLAEMDRPRLYIPRILRAIGKSELAGHAEFCVPLTSYVLEAVFIDNNAIQLFTDISSVGGFGKKAPTYQVLAQDLDGVNNPTWIATINEKDVKDAYRSQGPLLTHILKANPVFQRSMTEPMEAKDLFKNIQSRLERKEMQGELEIKVSASGPDLAAPNASSGEPPKELDKPRKPHSGL